MKAKTIIENKFWILEEEDGNKIGTVSVRDNIVTATINNNKQSFSNLTELTERYNINFIKNADPTTSHDMEVYGYPTAHLPHNALWHVTNKLPIYTKTIKSSNYHCAGYYIIKFKHGWVKGYCPKLITLQRYDHRGPYKSKIEMMEQLRLHNNEHI